MSIPGLDDWLGSAQGRYVLDWESSRTDAAVADVFGFNALQLGLPHHDFLRANRIPLRQKAGDTGPVDVLCDLTALPVAAHSTDLVVLPHVLEFAPDPHQILREIERILIPEGQLIVLGFNPLSLWGLRNRFERSGNFPWHGSYLSLLRLKDWLKLLDFEIDRGNMLYYRPPLVSETTMDRLHFLDKAGDRWWPFAGAVYVVQAVKRVPGMRLIQPQWKDARARAGALAPVVQRKWPWRPCCPWHLRRRARMTSS